MFLATSCLFTMYVCRVTLVMPDSVHVHGPSNPRMFGEEKQ